MERSEKFKVGATLDNHVKLLDLKAVLQEHVVELQKELAELNNITQPAEQLKKLYAIQELSKKVHNDAENLFSEKLYDIIGKKTGLSPLIV